MSKSGRGQKKGKRTGLKLFFVVMIVVVLAAGGYAVAFYHNFASSAAAVYKPVGAQPVRDSALLLEDRKPISILLIGIDNGAFGRDGEDGERSNAMIVVTLNPEEQKTTMVSIPRDTFTEIVGKSSYYKITHAYWYGGAKMAITTRSKKCWISQSITIFPWTWPASRK